MAAAGLEQVLRVLDVGQRLQLFAGLVLVLSVTLAYGIFLKALATVAVFVAKLHLGKRLCLAGLEAQAVPFPPAVSHHGQGPGFGPDTKGRLAHLGRSAVRRITLAGKQQIRSRLEVGEVRLVARPALHVLVVRVKLIPRGERLLISRGRHTSKRKLKCPLDNQCQRMLGEIQPPHKRGKLEKRLIYCSHFSFPGGVQKTDYF